jgi:hypothetical protein
MMELLLGFYSEKLYNIKAQYPIYNQDLLAIYQALEY